MLNTVYIFHGIFVLFVNFFVAYNNCLAMKFICANAFSWCKYLHHESDKYPPCSTPCPNMFTKVLETTVSLFYRVLF